MISMLDVHTKVGRDATASQPAEEAESVVDRNHNAAGSAADLRPGHETRWVAY